MLAAFELELEDKVRRTLGAAQSQVSNVREPFHLLSVGVVATGKEDVRAQIGSSIPGALGSTEVPRCGPPPVFSAFAALVANCKLRCTHLDCIGPRKRRTQTKPSPDRTVRFWSRRFRLQGARRSRIATSMTIWSPRMTWPRLSAS